MTHTLDVRLLGGSMVRVDGAPVVFPTRCAAGVFFYLALHAGRFFHRDVLTALYWGDRPQTVARKNFRTCLWRIRSAIEPRGIPKGTFLEVRGQSVGLTTTGRDASMVVDVQVFESWLRYVHPTRLDDEGQEEQLTRAVELYGGDFLEGEYDDWCQEERERLRQLLHGALERLVRLHLARADFTRAVERGRRLLQADPFREHVHRDLMMCFYRMGSRPLALRQYQRCAETLRAEMDLEPMAETRELRDRILEGRADLR